jgi:RNA polymerase sigma-70 factor (ECF subfamily)
VKTFLDRYAPEVAEDLTQQLFINLPRSLRGYHESGRFPAWLRTVAYNLYRTWFRSAIREGLETLNSRAAATSPTTSVFESKVKNLRELASGLPAGEKEAWLLYADGYRPREIGVKLGISAGAAATRVSRAKERLTEWILARYNPPGERM